MFAGNEANFKLCLVAEDVCRSRNLESKESTPGEDGDTESNNGFDAEGNEAENKSEKSTKSEYARIQEANTAKNREILQQLAEKYRLPNDPSLKKITEKKASKMKGKKKENNQEPTRSSAKLIPGPR
jgi:hypothetical protein